MYKLVPEAAGLILDFVAAREAPNGYNTIFGNHQNLLTKQITAMTLDELIENQRGFAKGFIVGGKRQQGSSASGRYQFMRDTLIGLKSEMKLSGAEMFTPDFQDRLGYQLLVRRGYLKYMSGTITRTAFGDQIAMEWASFPVLSASRQGAHRTVKRGQTYYAGDGVNKVQIHPEAVESILTSARELFGNAPIASALPPLPGAGASPSVATVQHTASIDQAPPVAPVAPRPAPVVAPSSPTPPTARVGALDRLATWWLGRKS